MSGRYSCCPSVRRQRAILALRAFPRAPSCQPFYPFTAMASRRFHSISYARIPTGARSAWVCNRCMCAGV
eukprot:352598-Chlamydomonas_euryale.AAC.4